MANLLPPDKAAANLAVTAASYADLAESIEVMLREGRKPDRKVLGKLQKLYSQVAAAHWELEQVLKG